MLAVRKDGHPERGKGVYMTDLNSVCICGRLTRDASVKQFDNSNLFDFTLAVNRSEKHGDEWQDVASFFDCKYWSKSYKMSEKLKKGQQVMLSGYLKQEMWNDKNGETKRKIVVMADFIGFAGTKSAVKAEEEPEDYSSFNF